MSEPMAANVTLNGSNGAAAADRPNLSADLAEPKLLSSPLLFSDMHKEMERALKEVEFPAPVAAERLAEAARYALLGGGKRVRPILVMACAQALGTPLSRVLPTACAIELIHTNSLIVDDLPAMDNHAKRRGRPTLHRVYGDDIAILAGCALLSEAQRLILRDQPGTPELRNRVLGVVLEATGTAGMVGGQFLDVTKYRPSDRADLERVQMLKTGSLIVACVRCGTLLAGNRTNHMFESFAESLGSLFQIVDDILDETGKARWLGKLPGSDRRAGKLTHVTTFGLERARERAKELHEQCLASLDQIASEVPGSTEPLLEIADMVYWREK